MIGTKPKVIPYIVAVDNLGKVVSQGTAVQASVADDRLKRAALWSWVQDWRMVSSDATVEKNAVERVYAEIGNGTPAAIKISDGYRDGSPLKLAQTETVSVNVRALYASSKDSYRGRVDGNDIRSEGRANRLSKLQGNHHDFHSSARG